jgi:hypothetical protein
MFSDAQKLMMAARIDIESYLDCIADQWLFGEGMSAEEHCRQIEKLERIQKAAESLGWDPVRSIWTKLETNIRMSFASEVAHIVPKHIVEAWLARLVTVSLPEIDPESADALGAIESASPIDDQNSPDRIVLDGIRLMRRARWDRDLHEQLELPECFYGTQDRADGNLPASH